MSSRNQSSHPRNDSSPSQGTFSFVVPQYRMDTPSNEYTPGRAGGTSRASFSSQASPEVDSSDSALEPSRRSGACVHCKSLKVRCEFAPGENACLRCQAGGHVCAPRSRKKRKTAPTHEDLQEKSLSQDRQIQEILRKLDENKQVNRIRDFMSRASSDSTVSPPSEFSELSYRRQSDPRSKRESVDAAELAVSAFFPNNQASGQQLHRFPTPDIVRYCGLYPDEIVSLFALFFDKVNPYFSILDPELHTPANLIWSSPFLFTVICAIASRYYDKRNLYPLAIEFARDAASRALIDGSKSVDICQAYLLLAVYPVPKKKWADDKSWILQGVAIRMAIALGLHQPPSEEYNERESLNRTRTWLTCFCVDGSHATQFGKLPMLPFNDYLARNSRKWYMESSHNLAFDIHLCAYVEMITVMSEFRSTILKGGSLTEPEEETDVASIAEHYDKQLQDVISRWLDRFSKEERQAHGILRYRVDTTRLISAYMRLVVLSAGFQHAVKDGISREHYIVQKSMTAARTAIDVVTDSMFPSGFLRWSMEAHFLYVAFAAAFLINLLRPKLLVLLDETEQKAIISVVRKLIKVLGSNDVALDHRHTPALYSRFLASQLARQQVSGDMEDDSSLECIVPLYGAERHQTPPYIFQWPDTSFVLQTPPAVDSATRSSAETIYQLPGEALMDFSPQYFAHTVTSAPFNVAHEQSLGDFFGGYGAESSHGQHFQANMPWSPVSGARDSWDAQSQHS